MWPPNEMAYLAKENGYFDGFDIELIESGSPAEYLPGYLAGGLDAAAVSLGTALELVDVEPRHKIVMLLDYSLGADALVAQSRYASTADLRGKLVGFESGALGAYVLARLLESAGLSTTDVTLVHLDSASHEQAFRGGEVDAVLTWQPVVSRLQSEGARVVADSRLIPEDVIDALVVRDTVLQAKRAQLKAFAAGWFKALEEHRREPQRAAARSQLRQHVSRDNYLKSFNDIVMLDRADNLRLMLEDPASLLATLERHRRFLTQAGLLRSEISVARMIDPSIISALP